MQVRVNYTGQTQFQIYSGSHVVWSDQPFSQGGNNAGMTPDELLLAALGSSAGLAAVQYCQTAGLDASGLSISVFGQIEGHPQRLDHLRLELHFPEAFAPEVVEAIQQAIANSLVYATLQHGIQLSMQVFTEVLKLPQPAPAT